MADTTNIEDQILSSLYNINNPTNSGSNIGNFIFINTSYIGGPVIATLSDIDALSNTKIITPAILDTVLKSVGGGGLYPTNAAFQSLIVSNLTITDTIIPVSSGGTGYNTYSTGDLLIGSNNILSVLPVGTENQVLQVINSVPSWADSPLSSFQFAQLSDLVVPTTVDNKIMSPYHTQLFLESPSVIGGITPNDAKFNNLTVGNLMGNMYASSSDAVDYTIDNKVMSPLSLAYSFSSPNSIGNIVPNTGSFSSLNAQYLQVTNPPWPLITELFATNEQAIAFDSQILSVTPGNLVPVFSYPPIIGDGTPSVGYFTNLTSNNITVNHLNVTNPPWPTLDLVFATSTEAINSSITDKAISPADIPSIMASPGPIGITTASNAIFKTVTMDNLTVTNPPWQTLSVLYASNNEAIDQTVTNKSLTPSNIPAIFATPDPIGYSHPSTGAFTNISTNTFQLNGDRIQVNEGGTGIGSYNVGDILVATGSTTLSQLGIGTNGQFLQVNNSAMYGYQWTTLSGNVPEATTSQYGVVRYASSGNISSFSGNNVIMSSQLSQLFASPPNIGSSNPNSGIFNNLTVTGNINLSSVLKANQGGTGLSGYNVGDILVANTNTSLTNLVKGSETQILQIVNGLPKWNNPLNVQGATNNVAGIVQIASTLDIQSYSSNNVVTCLGLGVAFDYPTNIGSGNPATGTFTTLNVNNYLNLSNNIVIQPSNGGTGQGRYANGDLLIGNPSSSLSILSKGQVGQILMVNPLGNVTWSNNSGGVPYSTTTSAGVVELATNAQTIAGSLNDVAITPSNLSAAFNSPGEIGSNVPSTGSFTALTTGSFELTGDLVQSNEGGTGCGTYNKGDLLTGNSSNGLSTVHIGADGLFLQANSGSSSGVSWGGVVLPVYYMNVSPPQYNLSTRYTISWSYSRNQANSNDILINAIRSIDITTIGITGSVGGIIQSTSLLGTVSNTGSLVTSNQSLNFNSIFIPGDVIYISGVGSRRIISISNTTLTVDSAFSSNNSSVAYYRGGRAANSIYYIYAFGDTINPGYALSNRSIINGNVLLDTPIGYSSTNYRQLPYVLITDSNSNFNRLTTTRDGYCKFTRGYLITSDNITTSFNTINLSTFIPQTSTLVSALVSLTCSSNSGGSVQIGINSSEYQTVCVLNSSGSISQSVTLEIDNFQSFVVLQSSNYCSVTISINGFWINII